MPSKPAICYVLPSSLDGTFIVLYTFSNCFISDFFLVAILSLNPSLVPVLFSPTEAEENGCWPLATLALPADTLCSCLVLRGSNYISCSHHLIISPLSSKHLIR